MARMFVYVLPHDSGFAPNPNNGYCTLACCKPRIRKSAKQTDWVVGITPGKLRALRALCYAMMITEEPLTFAQYHSDERFQGRRDNIYYPTTGGGYHQIDNGDHDKSQLPHDTSVDRVLISTIFWYFGRKPVALPPR